MAARIRSGGTGMREGQEPEDSSSAGIPLCVDLDGTLIRSDLLYEALARLSREGFVSLIQAPLWLSRGRAGFKREVANRVALEPSSLPYDERLIEFLRGEKSRGRRLVLVTASDLVWAEQVAAHLELFDEVMGSDGSTNLEGETKARALVERFGDRGFDYAGNGPADLPVWKKARRAIAVNAPSAIESGLRQDGNLAESFPSIP
ncbi:MAG: haloacid dehalogenase-like hydrolase, partial [Thermoanaerobaculia bacterium]